MPRLRIPALAVALLLALAGAPATGHAAQSQEAMFQDDALLVYPPRADVGHTLDTLRALGVDRIRVAVYWQIVAPDYATRTRPNFDATDPGAYPPQNWRPYDTIAELAQERGILVNFNVGGPAPLWATRSNPPAEDLANIYYPSPTEFRKFLTAVGRRYSGSYTPTRVSSAPSPKPPGLIPGSGGLTGGGGAAAAPPDGPLPRVSYWSIWNEPNQSFFLSPQWDRRSGATVETSPRVYRGLVDAAWAGLADSGHGGDTVLIGDLAPKGADSRSVRGSLKPLRFVRRLYCLDEKMRPLTGAGAARASCPTSDQRNAFPAAHPGLFAASGFADHPYSLASPPDRRSTDRDYVGIADLPRLTTSLRRIFATYGRRRAGLPLYITEFGYQSNPPDPFGFSPALQAAYINQAEFMSYVDPHVLSTQQFLLSDAGPDTRYPKSSSLYWSTFQTGLVDLDHHLKPAFYAYRMPVYVPNARRSRPGTFRVWGAARPAPNGSAQRVRVEYRERGQSSYAVIRAVKIVNVRSYVDTHVVLRRSGSLRLAWAAPTGRELHSRVVPIRIG